MEKLTKNRITVFICLALLVISAFFIRFDNFKKSKLCTVDENVYYCLGLQLKHNVLRYETSECANILIEMDPYFAPLPKYFYKPLFKHPPLFLYGIALSLKILGNEFVNAGHVSLLFGIFMIPLVYFLGKEFYDEKVGLLSAFFLWMDPINIICSQKIWMDTTLAFFTVLSVLFFAYGERRKKDNYFILSGISCGLAVLTKYPGILALFIVVIYAVIHNVKLFKNKKFLLSLALPFLMLIPWGIWNFSIYGPGFLVKMGNVHSIFLGDLRKSIIVVLFSGILLFVLIKIFFLRGKMSLGKRIEVDISEKSSRLRSVLVIIYGLLFFIGLFACISRSLKFQVVPYTSWFGGAFNYPLFYFERLIEFNFLYFFSLFSFFVYSRKRFEDASLLNISFFVIMIFFLLWGNFQSRYILATTPLLIVIGISFWMELFNRFRQDENVRVKILGCAILLALLCFSFFKTNYINFLISYPNNMCYF